MWAAAETFRRALALWRGEPLADAQGCLSLEAESARLTDARLDATEEWIDAELACGRHEAVHAELDQLVAANPLRERLARQCRVPVPHRPAGRGTGRLPRTARSPR
jgi:DNA-binding SARP family transcriptional activator